MDTAETGAAKKQDVSAQLAEIRDYMPEVYAAIKAKAAEMGNVAFELVRRALRGEAGCFWAIEGGRVVGTPFYGHPVMEQVGKALVQFGCAYVCIWPDAPPVTKLPRNREGARHSSPEPLAYKPSPPPHVGTPPPSNHGGNSAPARALVAEVGESPVSSPKCGG